MEINQLERSHPKVLVEELPILSVIPIEVHRLKLQVSRNYITIHKHIHTGLQRKINLNKEINKLKHFTQLIFSLHSYAVMMLQLNYSFVGSVVQFSCTITNQDRMGVKCNECTK